MRTGLVFLFSFLLSFLESTNASGQSLAFYADVMINADVPDHRIMASQEFDSLFEQALQKENSFTREFSELPWISIQYPRDSSFRSISWQIDGGEGSYSYHGYLQTNTNQLFAFAGKRGRSTLRSNDELSFEQWRGGLIYKILTIPGSETNYYLLTYSIVDAFTKVKTFEPIRFVGDQVIMGQKGLFEERKEAGSLTARLALKYSIDANAGITFDETSQRLVFDNLVVVEGRIPGQGPTTVPDGSYKAFELNEEGKWSYIDKLYSQWNEGRLDLNRDRTADNQLFKKKKNR